MNHKLKYGQDLIVGDVILYSYPSGCGILTNKTSHKIEKIVTLRGGNLSIWTYDANKDEMEKIAVDPKTLVVVYAE